MGIKPRSYLLLFLLVFLQFTSSQAHSQRALSGHLPSAVSNGQVKALGAVSPETRMDVTLVLPLRNTKELSSLLQRLYEPKSPDYRHFLSVGDFTERFGPTQQDYDAAVSFARANGLTVKAVAANRMVVPVSGTTQQVQNAFNVRMQRYQHPTEPRAFFSPDREPSVPAGVKISHVSGLNNYTLPKPMSLHAAADNSAAHSNAAVGSAPHGSYLPKDMRAAYYGDGELTGAGQTVALIEFDGYHIEDAVLDFAGAATLTNNGTDNVINYTPDPSGPTYSVPVHNVLLDGATGAPGQFNWISPNDDEQTLDIAQAIGMAPGLSQVRVYIGNSAVDMLNSIATENLAKQVSISWAWEGNDPAERPIFEELAAQGQSVFVASGDYGELDELGEWTYPAEEPWITAVGGTTLRTTGPGGDWVSETGWNRSGGGFSQRAIFPLPAWQAGIANASNMASTTNRNIPDVAAEADFDNYACNLSYCQTGYAGTSFGAPRWAGLAALMNEQAAKYGEPAVGFLNPLIYSMAAGSQYSTTFHDITEGFNAYYDQFGFPAVAGYDLVTGWGSPNAKNLIDLLAPPSAAGVSLIVSPSEIKVAPGGSETLNVSVVGRGGFNQPVTLSVSGLPQGVTASFSPETTSTSSTLTLSAGANIVGGSTLAQIVGVAPGVTTTAPLSITVSGPNAPLAITSPSLPMVPPFAQWILPGTSVAVRGTVIGGYENLRLEWAEGINPTGGWSSTGISLQASSSSSSLLNDGPVGAWDTSAINKADYYSLRLSAEIGGATQTSLTYVYVEPTLLAANWPQVMNDETLYNVGAIPARNADGTSRLAVITYDHVRAFAPDGTSTMVAPIQQSWTEGAAGDLNRTGEDAIVVGDAQSVKIVYPDGSSKSLSTAYLNGLLFFSAQPILEDVDGDSLLEILAIGQYYGQPTAYLFAWRNDGSIVNGFPIPIKDLNPGMAVAGTGTPANRVVVGDIDGDGKKEFLVMEGTSSSSFTPRLFAADGTPKTWNAPSIDGDLPEHTELADLDHNGSLETIILTWGAYVHVLQPDGTERPGWPQKVVREGGTVAIGDFYGNGKEEIVVSGAYIYVFNLDGSQAPGWPLLGDYGPAVLADINGDGLPEIVTSTTNMHSAAPGLWEYRTGQVLALDRDAKVVGSWNLPGGKNQYQGPAPYLTIGDFSGKGNAEIAATYFLMDWQGGVDVVDFNSLLTVFNTGSPLKQSANDWPMLRQNAQNVPVLRRVSASSVSLTPSANPSLPGASVAFTIAVADLNASGNTPSGRANLLDGASNIGSCQLITGSCTIQTTLAPSQHRLIAGYVGDTHFGESLSNPVIQTVEPESTSTALQIAPGTTVEVGSKYTVTATVSGTNSTDVPTGQVVLTAGDASATAALDGKGVATFSGTAPLMPGSFSISAAYQGADGYKASSSDPLQLTVEAKATTTAIQMTPSEGTLEVGTKYTLTATVSAVSVSDVPAGQVLFTVGDASVTATLDSKGVATYSGTLPWTPGPVSISAAYQGATAYKPSTSVPLQLTLQAKSTSTVLQMTPTGGTLDVGTKYTLTATVKAGSSSDVPTGQVVFTVGDASVTATLGSKGVATYSGTLPWTPGMLWISAAYQGVTAYKASAADPLQVTLQAKATSTSLQITPSTGIVEVGGKYVLAATVSAGNSTDVPAGQVVFTVGDASVSATLDARGGATYTGTAPSTPGALSISAAYQGATAYKVSNSDALQLRVQAKATKTTLQITPGGGSLAAGTGFTASATVKVVNSSDVTTGQVLFTVGDTIVSEPLDATGVATYTGTAPAAAGTLSISAAYQGATAYSASISDVLQETVYIVNPVPTLSGVTPAFVRAGSAATTVTVTGSGFVAGSQVFWGTTALATTLISGTQISAQVPASVLSTAGAYIITVQTPAPGGGISNKFQFEVDSAEATAGSPTFTSDSATVAAGAPASYPVTVPTTATSASVSCLNLPAGATCSYANGTVTINTASTTPTGTYQVTVVFTETLPGTTTAFVLLPVMLLPLALRRRRLAAKGVFWTVLFGAVMLAATAMWTGCGGGTSATTSTPAAPSTHQVTSSGVVNLTIK